MHELFNPVLFYGYLCAIYCPIIIVFSTVKFGKVICCGAGDMDAGDLLALSCWQRTTTIAQLSYCSIKLTDEPLITLNKEVSAVLKTMLFVQSCMSQIIMQGKISHCLYDQIKLYTWLEFPRITLFSHIMNKNNL